jgi:hypothetical protein
LSEVWLLSFLRSTVYLWYIHRLPRKTKKYQDIPLIYHPPKRYILVLLGAVAMPECCPFLFAPYTLGFRI